MMKHVEVITLYFFAGSVICNDEGALLIVGCCHDCFDFDFNNNKK